MSIAILAAALSLVQKRGYAAVTTEMIAAKAGVGKQSIYRRWPGKAELVVDAAVERRELPPHADSKAAAIVLYGALWYRLLLEEPLDAGFADRLCDLVLNGMLRKIG